MTWDLHVRLGDDLEEFVRAYAEARGITVTVALTALLTEARAAQKNS